MWSNLVIAGISCKSSSSLSCYLTCALSQDLSALSSKALRLPIHYHTTPPHPSQQTLIPPSLQQILPPLLTSLNLQIINAIRLPNSPLRLPNNNPLQPLRLILPLMPNLQMHHPSPSLIFLKRTNTLVLPTLLPLLLQSTIQNFFDPWAGGWERGTSGLGFEARDGEVVGAVSGNGTDSGVGC